MEKHVLSKSTFIRGNQCLKSLYLYKKRNFLRDKLSAEQRAKFKRGTNVGIIARDLFPGGIDVSPKSPSQYRKSALKTTELIQAGEKIIYEATFQYDGVLIMMDILALIDEKWYAFEVKSSKTISETYVLDAAVQYYVICGNDIALEDISLIHIDPEYIKNGSIDLKRLFKTTSVKDQVVELQQYVVEKIAEEKIAMNLTSSPKIEVGPQCHHPYPCDFYGHCHKKLPKNGIHQLHINEEDKWRIYDSGIKSLEEIKDIEAFQITEKTKDILRALVNKKVYCMQENRERLKNIQKSETIFVKVFGFRPAIPIYDGCMPYDYIPFAIGWKKNESEEFHFFEPGQNPMEAYKNILRRITSGSKHIITDYAGRIEQSSTDFSRQQIFGLIDMITNMEYYEAAIGDHLLSHQIYKNLIGLRYKTEGKYYSETLLEEAYKYEHSTLSKSEPFFLETKALCEFHLNALQYLFGHMRLKIS